MLQKKISETIDSLSDATSFKLAYLPQHGTTMPSVDELQIIVNLIKEVLFPGYFGISSLNNDTIKYYIGVKIDEIHKRLSTQIRRGICFACRQESCTDCISCEDTSPEICSEFISRLPEIRMLLASDVKAMFDGDPASKSFGEIIYCYPSIKALINHRIAHELLRLRVPLIPRIISEMAHSETGIDIHPGAQIGDFFAIDHGTGVVIGETCIIGSHVKIYQGVTLGAKSFPLDNFGNPIKGIPRHPIVEDNVIIYSHATILGRITIGANSIIGGNVWITNDLKPNSRIIQQKIKENVE